MVVESINWMAGGPQGSGVDSASTIFGRACGYGGLYVFGRREYHSNIKTMHSYFLQRISKQPTLANISDVNLLAAFDAETVVRHVGEVVSEGGIIVDSRDLDVNVLKDIATLVKRLQISDSQFHEGKILLAKPSMIFLTTPNKKTSKSLLFHTWIC